MASPIGLGRDVDEGRRGVGVNLHLNIPLVPKSQPRSQTVTIRPKNKPAFSHTYTPGDIDVWKSQLAYMVRSEFVRSGITQAISTAVRIDSLFVFPRPQKYTKRFVKSRATAFGACKRWKYPTGLLWHPVGKDIDNLQKALYDGLKPFWRDDCLVVCATPLKCLAEIDGMGRIELWLRTEESLQTPAEVLAEIGWPG